MTIAKKKKKIALMNSFNKMEGYKINTRKEKKSVAFVYTSSS